MDKSEYSELRKRLDFNLRYRWLIGHVLVDLLLAAPAIFLVWKGGLRFTPSHLATSLGAAGALAILYFRSFAMMHEAVHGLISTNKRWNDLGGLIYGALCFLPFEQWRNIHLVHHYWAGNVEKDPVRKLTLVYKKPQTFMHNVFSVMWRSWLPILATLQTCVFWVESAVRYRQKPGFSAFLGLVMPIAFWGTAFAAAGWRTSLLVLLPSVILYFWLVEVVNFPHHTDLPQYEGETKLSLWDQYKIARSCFYPKVLEKWVLLNFNYHTEHHLFPTLPWYQLEELSRELRLKIPDYNYSIGNAWIKRNRKRPLRDVCLSQSSGESKEAA